MPRESSCATHGDRFAERIVEVPVDEASFADTRLACAHTGCDCCVAMRGLWTAWGCKHTEEHQLQINLLHGEKKVCRADRQRAPGLRVVSLGSGGCLTDFEILLGLWASGVRLRGAHTVPDA